MGELKKVFRPELLNRIDEVIVFHKLTKDEIKTIVDLMMKRLREQMVEHEVAIELTERRRSCSSRRATTRRWARGRCAARSSASSRIRSPTSCSGRTLKPGSTIVVDRKEGEEDVEITIIEGPPAEPEPEKVTVPADEPAGESDVDEPSDDE